MIIQKNLVFGEETFDDLMPNGRIDKTQIKEAEKEMRTTRERKPFGCFECRNFGCVRCVSHLHCKHNSPSYTLDDARVPFFRNCAN